MQITMNLKERGITIGDLLIIIIIIITTTIVINAFNKEKKTSRTRRGWKMEGRDSLAEPKFAEIARGEEREEIKLHYQLFETTLMQGV